MLSTTHRCSLHVLQLHLYPLSLRLSVCMCVCVCVCSWLGYEHSSFNGQQFVLERGEYPRWESWSGSNAYHIERMMSFRPICSAVSFTVDLWSFLCATLLLFMKSENTQFAFPPPLNKLGGNAKRAPQDVSLFHILDSKYII